jgi:3-phenylpropionate/trans-cinnamate dioxygenase ferredoxin reductase subunit
MDERSLTISAVRSVGPDSIAIDVESPDGFTAQPGQFVKLTLSVDGEDQSRFYTISSPDVDGTLEMTVGIDPDGDVAPQLAELAEGDEIRLSGPFGSDYYEGEPRPILLAGGPGIGPAIGIAERAVADGHDPVIVYQDDDPIHEDRLDKLRSKGVSVSVLDSDISMEDTVAEATAEGGQVFMYGFAAFLDDATVALEAAGVETDDAKVENFG